LTAAGLYIDTLIAQGGCDSIVDLQLSVIPSPVVTLSLNFDTICNNGAAITLIGGLPAGGFYAGNGVVSNSLNPAIALVGEDTIVYNYIGLNGCVNSAVQIINIEVCTSINGQSKADEIQMYPNPVNDLLTLQSDLFANNQTVTLMLFDVTGKSIAVSYYKEADKFVIEAAKLSAGVYLIRFNINGKQVNRKFVKMD
jgi:hypothetical protein